MAMDEVRILTATTSTTTRRRKLNKRPKVDERTNYVEVKTEEKKTVLLVCRDNERDQENAWYLDTGASNHMCGRRSMFVELDESVAGNVSFGDDSKISVKGKGNILIRDKDGSH
ncbi:hypothetical protein ACOSQ2_012238 [Xanthoceras sorbifolium]